MKDGWKPEKKVYAVPIPLRFKDKDMDSAEMQLASKMNHPLSGTVLYQGFRPKDSIVLHKEFLLNYKGGLIQSQYPFNFPQNMNSEVSKWLEKTSKTLQ